MSATFMRAILDSYSPYHALSTPLQTGVWLHNLTIDVFFQLRPPLPPLANPSTFTG
jgi:hypothetical protein